MMSNKNVQEEFVILNSPVFTNLNVTCCWFLSWSLCAGCVSSRSTISTEGCGCMVAASGDSSRDRLNFRLKKLTFFGFEFVPVTKLTNVYFIQT